MNALLARIAGIRWLKKPIRSLLPPNVAVTLKDGFRVWVDARDLRGPSYHILYGRDVGFQHYEEVAKKEVLNALPPDGVFLDVGANIGLFSLFAKRMRPNAKIYAFEPHPLLAKSLKCSIADNNLSGIFVEEASVGSQAGELSLFLDDSDSGGHSMDEMLLQENSQDIPSSRVPHLRVKSTSLDQWLSERLVAHVDVIKIDVQGFEDQVLEGALELLERSKPVLVVECDHQQLLEGDACIRQLRKISKVQYMARAAGEDEVLSLDGIKKIAEKDLSKSKRYRDYVFSPMK